MQYLNDHWTNEVHLLGRESFAKAARDLILHAETPFAMSIGGRWGMGKTSMLRVLMESLGGTPISTQSSLFEETSDQPQSMLCDELRILDTVPGENAEQNARTGAEKAPKRIFRPNLDETLRKKLIRVKTVWFNPWHYQHEENPILPLLHEIREQVRQHYKVATWLEDEKASMKHLIEAGLNNLGNLVDHAATLLTPLSKVSLAGSMQAEYRENKARHREETFANPVDAQRFFLQFQKAIEQLSGGEPNQDEPEGRVVVFIDDLDRCHDEVVFRLLEAIKLYLSSRRCVFVFGLDTGHVETAICRATAFKPREAAQYVEKLFQIRVNLPIPGQDNLSPFLTQHVQALFDQQPEIIRDTIHRDCLQYLPRNPRLIKNTLNGLKIAHALKANRLEEEHQKPEDFWHKLLLVHLFRAFYPDAYEVLLENRRAALVALRELENNQEPEKPDAMQLYLRRILANPLYQLPLESLEKATDLTDDQYREVRAGVWQASAFQAFQEEFIRVFARNNDVIQSDTLGAYLL